MSGALAWFPFYVDAWETDERVRGLTYEERGVYIAMLCWQWREGSLPPNPRDVTVALRARHRVVLKLLGMFFVPENGTVGRVVNEKLERVREQQVARLMKDREKMARFRERSRERNGNAPVSETVPSAPRSRSRIRSRVIQSLSAHAEDQTAKPGSSPSAPVDVEQEPLPPPRAIDQRPADEVTDEGFAALRAKRQAYRDAAPKVVQP